MASIDFGLFAILKLRQPEMDPSAALQAAALPSLPSTFCIGVNSKALLTFFVKICFSCKLQLLPLG